MRSEYLKVVLDSWVCFSFGGIAVHSSGTVVDLDYSVTNVFWFMSNICSCSLFA